MKKLIIFGTGDAAQLAHYYFGQDTDYHIEGFTVDSSHLTSDSFENKPVVAFENLASIYSPREFDLFIGLGYTNMNKVRALKYQQAKAAGYTLASYISPQCTYRSQFKPGDNCFIFEDNTIQPFVKIGNNVTMWSGNHIGHHSIIEDNNFITSHVVISGHCRIEANCFLGVNSTLHNNIRIGRESLIGAGAVISKNVNEKSVFLPAKSTLFAKKSDEINF
jgi:sugar O-acyltransferase (sialic acid O-acetyltransferase NeuD family)